MAKVQSASRIELAREMQVCSISERKVSEYILIPLVAPGSTSTHNCGSESMKETSSTSYGRVLPSKLKCTMLLKLHIIKDSFLIMYLVVWFPVCAISILEFRSTSARPLCLGLGLHYMSTNVKQKGMQDSAHAAFSILSIS